MKIIISNFILCLLCFFVADAYLWQKKAQKRKVSVKSIGAFCASLFKDF